MNSLRCRSWGGAERPDVDTTAPIDTEAIAYTMNPGDSPALQIFDSATAFEDFASFGGADAVALPR